MLRLHKAGFYSSVQDKGRLGFRDKGVPVSGAMDSIAFTLANQLLENNADAPVLEITMMGPKIEFLEATSIAITGADFTLLLNDNSVSNYKVIKIEKGDILQFKRLNSGVRAYLAVKGGFTSEKVMNSASFYQPITSVGRLENGATLPYTPHSNYQPVIDTIVVNAWVNFTYLEVYKGPEFSILDKAQIRQLLTCEFTVAMENSRMGYQLQETIGAHDISMLTSATLPGTVQCTQVGKLIILMKDAPTTGGYPRVLQLSSRAISVLAQKRFGSKIRFKIVG